jgi:hypothetical protein
MAEKNGVCGCGCVFARVVCVCVHGVYLCTWVYMCVHGCVCVYMGVYVRVCVYMCVHVCTWVHVCVHGCISVYIVYIGVYVCT